MIVISGQKLIGRELIDISPLDNPLRTAFFALPVIIFTYLSLQFFKNITTGVTLLLPRTGLPWPVIYPGKLPKSKFNPKKYYLSSYDGPLMTAFLGLFLFAAGEFFLVIMFKTFSYTFAPL